MPVDWNATFLHSRGSACASLGGLGACRSLCRSFADATCWNSYMHDMTAAGMTALLPTASDAEAAGLAGLTAAMLLHRAEAMC